MCIPTFWIMKLGYNWRMWGKRRDEHVMNQIIFINDIILKVKAIRFDYYMQFLGLFLLLKKIFHNGFFLFQFQLELNYFEQLWTINITLTEYDLTNLILKEGISKIKDNHISFNFINEGLRMIIFEIIWLGFFLQVVSWVRTT
jgi:hypothetical protein